MSKYMLLSRNARSNEVPSPCGCILQLSEQNPAIFGVERLVQEYGSRETNRHDVSRFWPTVAGPESFNDGGGEGIRTSVRRGRLYFVPDSAELKSKGKFGL